MALARTLVDKGLGLTALTLTGLAGLGAARSVVLVIQGPGPGARLAGLAGLGLAAGLAPFAGYIGYRLLRYPPEQRITAAAIARLAARRPAPLTPRWEGG